jgi:hypothetical protein
LNLKSYPRQHLHLSPLLVFSFENNTGRGKWSTRAPLSRLQPTELATVFFCLTSLERLCATPEPNMRSSGLTSLTHHPLSINPQPAPSTLHFSYATLPPSVTSPRTQTLLSLSRLSGGRGNMDRSKETKPAPITVPSRTPETPLCTPLNKQGLPYPYTALSRRSDRRPAAGWMRTAFPADQNPNSSTIL